MKTTCKQPFKIEDVLLKLTPYQQEAINTVLFDVYLRKTDDIRKCPNSNCSYAGMIDPSTPCRKKLECSDCGTQWREKVHYTTAEKMMDFVINRNVKKNEILSTLWEEMFTRRCPKCNVSIQKSGGCNHMTCKKCQYEFCWLCYQKHQKHSNTFCRFSSLAKLLLLLFPILSIMYLTGIAQLIFSIVSWVLGFFIAGFLFQALKLGFEFLYIKGKERSRHKRSQKKQREIELICFAILFGNLVLLGILRSFEMYSKALTVGCIEVLLSIVIKLDINWDLQKIYRMSYYIKRNRRGLFFYYICIKSYFIR